MKQVPYFEQDNQDLPKDMAWLETELIKGTRTNGINKYILSTIGVPKIIGSLIPHIPGNTLKRPIERICFDFDLHINKTSPNVFPAPPINTYLNICKLIIAVGAFPALTSSAFTPVFAIHKAKTIGKTIEEPLIPNNHKIFENK